MNSKEEYKQKQQLSSDAMFYSQKRMGILIISICGAGIYLTLETIKFLSQKKPPEDNILIEIAGTLFLLGIVANFISQTYSYKTHRSDYLMYQVYIDSAKKLKKDRPNWMIRFFCHFILNFRILNNKLLLKNN